MSTEEEETSVISDDQLKYINALWERLNVGVGAEFRYEDECIAADDCHCHIAVDEDMIREERDGNPFCVERIVRYDGTRDEPPSEDFVEPVEWAKFRDAVVDMMQRHLAQMVTLITDDLAIDLAEQEMLEAEDDEL